MSDRNDAALRAKLEELTNINLALAREGRIGAQAIDRGVVLRHRLDMLWSLLLEARVQIDDAELGGRIDDALALVAAEAEQR